MNLLNLLRKKTDKDSSIDINVKNTILEKKKKELEEIR